MSTLPPPVLVLIGILSTAFAQAILKKAAAFDARTAPWLLYMGMSVVSYGISFISYAQVLKHYPLNKIYPAMTVAQIIIITLYGLWIGEVVDGRHAIGLLLGILAIYLILG